MLAPKKVKYRKIQKGRVRGAESRGLELAFGDFGLKSTETARVDTRALEAARIALTRHIKRGGRVWRRTSCRSRQWSRNGRPKQLELDELRQMTVAELRVKEREIREEIFRLRR